ncbi:MAG: hypothetical protein U1E56_02305 [Bauldia sp.]
MYLHNIADLLPFLNRLYDRGAVFHLTHPNPDSVTVTIRLADSLVEVDFFAERVAIVAFQRSPTAVEVPSLLALIDSEAPQRATEPKAKA